MRRWKQVARALVLGVVTAMALTAEARAADSMVLFYNDFTGLAMTARVEANGNVVGLRTFRFDPYWGFIVPTGNGLVLFYKLSGVVATGRFQADGSYQDLQSGNGLFDGQRVVSTSDGILLFNNANTGVAATGRVDANGNYADLRFFIGWVDRKIVPTTNGLVLFYSPSGVVEAGWIGADGSFHDLKYNPGFNGWTHVVSVR